jgi:hypothetical protein
MTRGIEREPVSILSLVENKDQYLNYYDHLSAGEMSR